MDDFVFSWPPALTPYPFPAGGRGELLFDDRLLRKGNRSRVSRNG
jgi:hypothetical protein